MTTKHILYGMFIKGGRWLVFVPVLYMLVTVNIYRFKHPEKTETQLFKEKPKAILMKW